VGSTGMAYGGDFMLFHDRCSGGMEWENSTWRLRNNEER